MLLTWECKLKNIGEFHIDVEYKNKAGHWVQLNNSPYVSVDPAKSYYNKKKGNQYQYTFNAPSDPTVTQVHARVCAVAKTRTVKKSYPEKSASGKTVKEYVELELAYWKASYTGWAVAVAPAQSDADKAKQAKPTVKLPAPSAVLRDDGSIRVTWSKPTEATVTSVALCRLDDGAAEGKRVQVGSGRFGLNTLEYVDKGVGAGHCCRYLLVPYNGNSGTWGPVGTASADVQTVPLAPTGLKAVAAGADSATLTWGDNGYRYCGASYAIYACPHSDAWRRDKTGAWVPARDDIREVANSLSRVGTANQFTVTGLDAGEVWWFTVALVGDGGASALATPASCAIATVPAAPTQGFLPAFAMKGDSVELSWTHNSEDGSAQSASEVELTVEAPGSSPSASVISCGTSPSYVLDTSEMEDGTVVGWRVRTKGVSPSWSPWSGFLEFAVLVQPEATIELYQGHDGGTRVDFGDPLAALPLVVAVTAGAGTSQAPVEYAVEVVASEGFSFVDESGEDDWMAGGTVIASFYITADDEAFDASRQVVTIGAGDGAFSSGAALAIRAMAAMDSGLRTDWAEASTVPEWSSSVPLPEAAAAVLDDYSAAIWPVCEDPREPSEGTVWMLEGTRLTIVSVPGAPDEDPEGEAVVTYLSEDGTESTYSDSGALPIALEMSNAEGYVSPVSAEVALQSGTYTLDLSGSSALQHEVYDAVRLADDVLLGVYRMEDDGELVEVATQLENTGTVMVTDPHPSFGTCRYRITANSQETDETVFSVTELELPYEFLYIQWDEDVSTVIQDDDDGALVTRTGEAVSIDADIVLTEAVRKDKTLNEYAGRSHPVVDYGTQVGETGSSSGAVNLDLDMGKLSQLRKLKRHMGTCYVRWPARYGGLGYTADVDVDITYPRKGVKASVRLDITRVEEDAR